MKSIKLLSVILCLSIVMFAFSGCKSGKDDESSTLTPQEFAIQNDELIKPAQNDLFRYKIYNSYVSISEYVGEETNVTIPDTIEDKPVYVIEDNAFIENQVVSNIVISNNIVKLGVGVFSDCISLKKITLSNNITEIPSEMCSGCESLEEITIPNLVQSIGSSAFSRCVNLEKVVIPSAVQIVDSGCFTECTNLKKVVFMDGVISDENGDYMKTVEKELGASLFSGCESLEYVLIPDSVTTIDSSMYDNTPASSYIYGYVPSAVTSFCAENKINFIEVVEGDDKDRQMKDRSIVIPEVTSK